MPDKMECNLLLLFLNHVHKFLTSIISLDFALRKLYIYSDSYLEANYTFLFVEFWLKITIIFWIKLSLILSHITNVSNKDNFLRKNLNFTLGDQWTFWYICLEWNTNLIFTSWWEIRESWFQLPNPSKRQSHLFLSSIFHLITSKRQSREARKSQCE